MGNNLCKERIENASNSKSPIDRMLTRCAQICPNSNKNNYWNKHVFETCPPQQNQPQRSDSWRNATLTVPDDKLVINNNQTTIPPKAPPRRKRGNTFSNGVRPVRNGFKDVFGNEDRRYSHESIISREKSVNDSVDGDGNKLKNRSFSSYDIPNNDEFSDFTKEIIEPLEEQYKSNRRDSSQIGNKKTDKFFGENLSDCLSNKKEMHSRQDDLDKIIEANNLTNKDVESKVQKSTTRILRSPPPEPPKRKISSEIQNESHKKINDNDDLNKSSSLDRKAEFLMAMLNAEPDENSDEKYYANRQPIEEPLMVMVKKPRGCVCCDDDDTLRKHLHRHEQKMSEADNSVNLHSTSNPNITENAPMKPLRDFSKYRQSIDLTDEIINPTDVSVTNNTQSETTQIQRPIRNKTKRSLSREEQLPDLPPRPKRSVEDENNYNYESLSPPISKPTKAIYINPPAISLTLSSSPSSPNSMKVRPPPPIPPKPIEKPKVKLQRNISMPVSTTNQVGETNLLVPTQKIEVIKKCKSSNSFLTQELMNEIVKKAYGFGFNEDFCSEHFDNHDGSALVSPSSKLSSRKLVKSTSLDCSVNNDNDKNKTSFTIGKEEIQISLIDSSQSPGEFMKQQVEGKLDKVVESKSNIEKSSKPIETKLDKVVKSNAEQVGKIETKLEKVVEHVESRSNAQPQKKEEQVEHKFKTHENFLASNLDAQNLGHILESSGLDIDSLSNVLDDIYKTNKTILEDFQNYLEESRDETESQTSNRKINHRVQLKNELSVDDSSLEKLSIASTSEDFDLDKEDLDLIDTESEKEYLSDNNEVVNELRKTTLNNKYLHPKHEHAQSRRDSIDDVEKWFSEHLEMPIKNRSISDIIHGCQKGRRGSEGMIVYDDFTVFPFGKASRERTVSESAEFFDYNNSTNNLPININTNSKVSEDQDHSKLLKLLQKESPSKQI